MDPNWAFVFLFFGCMSFVSTFVYFWPEEFYILKKKFFSYFSK